MKQTQLLVIGVGPYALSAAALAREHGIQTMVLGRPMGFWRQNMPEGMFLRSGPDWHFDPSAVHTLEAYLEQRGIRPDEVDPIPVSVFLGSAAKQVARSCPTWPPAESQGRAWLLVCPAAPSLTCPATLQPAIVLDGPEPTSPMSI